MDDQRIVSADAARQLHMDMNTLRKYARFVGIRPQVPSYDRRLRTYSADDLARINERYRHDRRQLGLAPVRAPSADVPRRSSADLLARLAEVERRLARLEANPAQVIRVPSPRVSEPASAFSARPAPVLTRPLSYGLPEGLVSWRTFAQVHGLPESTVKHQIDAGALRVIVGRWKVGYTYVKGALDAGGRRQFYQLWSGRENWRRCDACPHEHEEAAHSPKVQQEE